MERSDRERLYTPYFNINVITTYFIAGIAYKKSSLYEQCIKLFFFSKLSQ